MSLFIGTVKCIPITHSTIVLETPRPPLKYFLKKEWLHSLFFVFYRWTWLVRLRLERETVADLTQPPLMDLQLWHFHTSRFRVEILFVVKIMPHSPGILTLLRLSILAKIEKTPLPSPPTFHPQFPMTSHIFELRGDVSMPC